MIAVLRGHLQRAVRPRFYVDVEETVYIVDPDDPVRRVVRPDVFVVERLPGTAVQPGLGQISRSVVVEVAEADEVRLPSLVLFDRDDNHVVATIELLSPVNKAAGSRARREFLEKRRRGLESTAHWIEIDLLRAGERPLEVRGRSDYYAALHRAGAGADLQVWFFNLSDPLPTIAVPLRPGLPDVPLDLRVAVVELYDQFDYDLVINYETEPPAPPLTPDQVVWAAERIAQWSGPKAG
jgi:hypothetical protein